MINLSKVNLTKFRRVSLKLIINTIDLESKQHDKTSEHILELIIWTIIISIYQYYKIIIMHIKDLLRLVLI